MKVIILAGGYGTRISEESKFKPKSTVELGGQPILWHIMKLYSHQGYNNFIICAGYKQHIIKEYFADYFLHTSDITYDFTNGRNEMVVHHNTSEPWRVTVVDTGLNTMTGGRIKRIQEYIGNEPFMLTYGDGVCDVNLTDLFTFTSGVYETEGDFAWTEGDRAEFCAFISEEIVEDLELTLNLKSVFAPPQRMLVVCDDLILYDEEIEPVNSIAIPIPKECVKNHCIRLQLLFPDTVSPSELGYSADVRKLALGIMSFSLRRIH